MFDKSLKLTQLNEDTMAKKQKSPSSSDEEEEPTPL